MLARRCIPKNSFKNELKILGWIYIRRKAHKIKKESNLVTNKNANLHPDLTTTKFNTKSMRNYFTFYISLLSQKCNVSPQRDIIQEKQSNRIMQNTFHVIANGYQNKLCKMNKIQNLEKFVFIVLIPPVLSRFPTLISTALRIDQKIKLSKISLLKNKRTAFMFSFIIRPEKVGISSLELSSKVKQISCNIKNRKKNRVQIKYEHLTRRAPKALMSYLV